MSLRAQRERFFRQHPFCYWCSCELVLIETEQHSKGPFPDNMATIDHLRPRGDRRRLERNRFNLWRRVLACRKCNAERDRKFTARRSLEELWRASGKWLAMVQATGAINEVTG